LYNALLKINIKPKSSDEIEEVEKSNFEINFPKFLEQAKKSLCRNPPPLLFNARKSFFQFSVQI
jgi:hypothetical protein